MNLEKYFEVENGTGILATASKDGEVNTAIYARPHIINNSKAAFIMRKKKTYANLLETPNANYMFIAREEKMTGIRMYLRLAEEIDDPAVIEKYRRKNSPVESNVDYENVILTIFDIKKVIKLIGDTEIIFRT
jgi:putative heme iron utilization protein